MTFEERADEMYLWICNKYKEIVDILQEPEDNNPTEWVYFQLKEERQSFKWIVDNTTERMRNMMGQQVSYYSFKDRDIFHRITETLSLDSKTIRANHILTLVLLKAIEFVELTERSK